MHLKIAHTNRTLPTTQWASTQHVRDVESNKLKVRKRQRNRTQFSKQNSMEARRCLAQRSWGVNSFLRSAPEA